MAHPIPKPTPEADGPGTRSFTTGLVAAFRTQVRAVVKAAQDRGVPVAGRTPDGERVVLQPTTDRKAD